MPSENVRAIQICIGGERASAGAMRPVCARESTYTQTDATLEILSFSHSLPKYKGSSRQALECIAASRFPRAGPFFGFISPSSHHHRHPAIIMHATRTDDGNSVHVRVPATTANLGPGFDCMGEYVVLLWGWGRAGCVPPLRLPRVTRPHRRDRFDPRAAERWVGPLNARCAPTCTHLRSTGILSAYFTHGLEPERPVWPLLSILPSVKMAAVPSCTRRHTRAFW